MLQRALSAELELGLYGAALRTAERLAEAAGRGPVSEEVESIIEDLRSARASDAYLSVEGQLAPRTEEDADGMWIYDPLRRLFGLEDVEGEISTVDVRCVWGRAQLSHDPDVAVRLPDDWGACNVLVIGEPGTTFRLIEYPDGHPTSGG